MRIKEARELLGITDTIFTLKELKQQYRINALRYHPDKIREIDTSAKFQEIKAAYDYLLPYVISDSELDMDEDEN